jgi:cysteine synthase A
MAKEILMQLNDKVDAWVSSVGTGGNFMGVSKVLKKHSPHVRCIAVEPTGWAGFEGMLSGWKTGTRQDTIPGITGGISKQIVDEGIADEVIQVGNDEARHMAYRLSREEGVFVGISTGANVFVAMNEAKKLGPGKNVVTVAVDSGDRYFSDERYIT